MRRHTHALTALTAAAALAVGVPAAASAQTWTHADPAGDVVKSTYDLQTDEETEAVDPTITNGDVIGSTIKHNPRKVIATVRFRDLVAPGADELSLFVMSVRTDKLNRDLTVAAMAGHTRGVRELSRPNGDTVRCRGLAHRIDYTANTVTMVVPRSCLGRPRWVRAGAGAVRMPDFGAILSATARAGAAPTPTTLEMYADDAHSGSVRDRLTLSPRLRRG